MKHLLIFISFFLVIPSVKAQTPTASLLAKKWKYIGTEEFAVVSPPDSLHQNDWVELRSDGTYEWSIEGKLGSGTWKLGTTGKIITFTDTKTKKNLNYNLKKVTETDLTLEYQTPDLVRTRYRYQSVKE